MWSQKSNSSFSAAIPAISSMVPKFVVPDVARNETTAAPPAAADCSSRRRGPDRAQSAGAVALAPEVEFLLQRRDSGDIVGGAEVRRPRGGHDRDHRVPVLRQGLPHPFRAQDPVIAGGH